MGIREISKQLKNVLENKFIENNNMYLMGYWVDNFLLYLNSILKSTNKENLPSVIPIKKEDLLSIEDFKRRSIGSNSVKKMSFLTTILETFIKKNNTNNL
jgi:hypothetical protein